MRPDESGENGRFGRAFKRRQQKQVGNRGNGRGARRPRVNECDGKRHEDRDATTAHEVAGFDVIGGFVTMLVCVFLNVQLARHCSGVLVSTRAESFRVIVSGVSIAANDTCDNQRKRCHGRNQPHRTASMFAREHWVQTTTNDALCAPKACHNEDPFISLAYYRGLPEKPLTVPAEAAPSGRDHQWL